MSEVHLINARLPLRDELDLYELKAVNGVWVSVQKQERMVYMSESIPIQDITPRYEHEEGRPVDLAGRIVLPGFVDAHTHLDKAFTIQNVKNRSGTLFEAIKNYNKVISSFTKEDIKRRIEQAVLQSVKNGTVAIRSHLNFPYEYGESIAFRTIYAALGARESLRDIVDIQYVLMVPSREHSAEMWRAVEEAIKAGIDIIGGAPHVVHEHERFTDELFKIAVKYNIPIDLHTDERDDPHIQTISYLAEKTIAEGYQGKVTAGHLCTLSAIEPEKANTIINRMLEAELSAITLPASNLYLQGREDEGPVRRGITRVKELLHSGIKTAVASDNIQDPFHPFGNGDLLQAGLLTAYAAHMGSEDELQSLLQMITSLPASILGLSQYGIEAGHPVRFVVCDAQTHIELFSNLSPNRWVYRDFQWLHVSRKNGEWGNI
ncbi:amidohydrolase family protein [Metabacillus fastidiosus]|uniref:Amidohydrolase family protein n=1 Tax=Metabacillus fastidiosus TaxID=1458 RepID=A0ABU6P246_9BACI|nr:amidohydrolase family protein [Metabacillus fastidiosus]